MTAGSAIRRNDTVPIYAQIETFIRQKIEQGEWAPDAMLPTERQLCEQYGTARMTVRQAINNLVNAGLLTRTRGKGTFVNRPPLRQSLGKLSNFTEDMRDRGLMATTRLLTREILPATEPFAHTLAVPSGTPILHLKRLRFAPGQPMAVEACALRGDIALPLQGEDVERQSLYSLLEQHCHVTLTRAGQDIEAGEAGEAEASLLDIEPGTPLLRIRRTTFALWCGQEVPCEHVRSTYRSDRYRFFVELRR